MTITVKELKAIVAGWPEEDDLGEPTEVWLQTAPGVSSEALVVEQLNRRVSDTGTVSADLLIAGGEY